MLDINKIREDQEGIKTALLKRMDADKLETILAQILKFDEERRDLIHKTEELKAERNKHSKTKPTPEIIANMKEIGEKIKEIDTQLAEVDIKFNEAMSELPNIPAEDVVAGGKENNKIVKTYLEKPSFDFEPKIM